MGDADQRLRFYRQQRANQPDEVKRERARKSLARSRAISELRAKHKAEYDALYANAYTQLGE